MCMGPAALLGLHPQSDLHRDQNGSSSKQQMECSLLWSPSLALTELLNDSMCWPFLFMELPFLT